MDAITIVVENGVQMTRLRTACEFVGQTEYIVIKDLTSNWQLCRKRGSQIEKEAKADTIVSNIVLDFFWRIITKVTEYFTRIRRFFVFTPATERSIELKEGRGNSENDIKVEEGLVQDSGARKPELAEFFVSEKGTTNDGQDLDADSNAVKFHHENRGTRCCTLQIKVDEHQSGISEGCKRTISDENQEDRVTEVTVQPTCDPHQQESNSLTCDSAKVVQQLCQEDCENCLQITMHEQSGACDVYKPTLGIDNHDARQIEYPSPTEQATGDPYQQEPHYVICEPVEGFPLGLNDGHCRGEAQHQTCQIQEQNASKEDHELPDVVISNNCITLQAPSPPSVACNPKLDKSVADGSLEPPILSTSSKTLSRTFSIQQLNAIVAEQFTKYLQVLERSMDSGKSEHSTWSHRTTHWRAIILATLVAVAVWATNAKHLYESMPRIKGSAINVHIRSRL